MSALDSIGKLTPAGMTPSETVVYNRAASKGRAAYLRKNGGPSTGLDRFAPAIGSDERAAFCAEVREQSASWYAAHSEAYENQAHAYGMRALRKRLADLGDEERAARFAAPRKTRKAPARKAVAAPVVEVAETTPVPVAVVSTPTVVPAPMPTMTRAARKASNRELAAAMRAAGVAVTRENWDAAKSGQLAGFEVSA